MGATARTRHSGGPDVEVDGAVDALRRSLDALRAAPEVVILLVVLAPIQAYLGPLGNLIWFVAQSVGIVYLAAAIPGVTEPGSRTDNSLPVRILISFIAGFLTFIAVLAGLLAVVFPGLYLFVRLYLVTPAVLLDDHGPIGALGASWARTSGNELTVAGVALTLFGAGLLIAAATLLLVAGGVDPAIERVMRGEIRIASAVTSAVVGPVGVAAMVVLYEGLAE